MNGAEVIVVDDMPDFTRNIKNILDLDDIGIKVFNEPEKFLDYSKREDFFSTKIIIMDYSMPNLNGFNVFQRLFEIHPDSINQYKMILYTANIEQVDIKEKEYLESVNIEIIKKPNIQLIIDKIYKKVNPCI